MFSQMKYLSKLKGARVLIIGGSTGIGYGLAEACIENQVSELILSSSQQSKIDTAIFRLQESYPTNNPTITGISCDLGDESNFESNIERLFASLPCMIDHVIVTAGDALDATPLDRLDFSTLKQAGIVRFFAPFFIAKTAVTHMSPGPASSITFTTGSSGDKPLPGRPAINAYAAGLHGLARSLALDLRPIRVNVVSLGTIDSEFWDRALGPDLQDRKASIFEAQGAKLATGVVGRVEDVVESYLSLLKDRNVTGTVIRTDAGRLIM